MKIKVIKAFNDKENGFVTRPVNEVFEATEARAQELIGKGFAIEVKDEKPTKKTAKKAADAQE